MDEFGDDALQPLRLDRGRRGHHRHARRTCAAAPGTAGRPPPGTGCGCSTRRRRGRRPATTGRIFVGSELLFEGYTGGGTKEVIDGFMSTGDIGHFDDDGRLFVDGRDDEMIVSGGENVFPREVEDLLVDHADGARRRGHRRRRRASSASG